MMQIWFLSNGSYSLKKCHNPFGKAIQPPPPYGKIPVEHLKSLHGASLMIQVSRCIISFYSLVRGATPGPIVRLRIGTLHTRPPSSTLQQLQFNTNTFAPTHSAGEILRVKYEWVMGIFISSGYPLIH